MPQWLSTLNTSVQWGLLRKGPRVFALLGKATSSGLTSFARGDISRAWAVTAELGCLRLEKLTGDEEVTGDHFYLPTPYSYEYGILGPNDSPEVTRAVFGLLPGELEKLVTTMRRGSFPVLGYSDTELKCGVSSCLIPPYWPHVVISNLALYGNVVSLEAFMRILITSMPHGHLTVRYPDLQPVIKQVLRLLIVQRRGMHYTRETVELATLSSVAAAK